jgi:hypothetical protein
MTKAPDKILVVEGSAGRVDLAKRLRVAMAG